MSKYKKRSKKERQAWWRSLTDEQQEWYVDLWQTRKEAKRKREMLKDGTQKKNCTNCLLGVGGHCEGYGPKKICKDWYEIVNL